MNFELVIVKFVDIVSDATWSTTDDIDTMTAHAVGWLVFSNDTTVKIANTIDEEGNPSGITAFPKGTIHEIKKIVTTKTSNES